MTSDAAASLFFKILVAALAGGAGAIIIVTLWLERILAGWEAIGLFTGCVIFTGLTISAATGPAYFLMLLAMVGIAGGCWIGTRLSERSLRKRLIEEDETKARKALEFDYNNVAAHSLLADVYARRGQWAKAIEEYEISLELQPGQPEERFKLEQAVRRLSIAEGRSRECPSCGAEWPKESQTCPECGRSSRAVVLLRKWLTGGGVETLGWGAIAILAIGVLLLTVQLLAAALAVLAVALWLGSIALVGWRYFKRPT